MDRSLVELTTLACNCITLLVTFYHLITAISHNNSFKIHMRDLRDTVQRASERSDLIQK